MPEQHNEAITEVSVEDFSQVMRTHFDIFNEPVVGKPYAVRYTGSPYVHSSEDCKSLQVFSHAKGTMFCPLNILAVLDKFEIPEASYREAIAGQGKLLKMKPQSSSEAHEGRQSTIRGGSQQPTEDAAGKAV